MSTATDERLDLTLGPPGEGDVVHISAIRLTGSDEPMCGSTAPPKHRGHSWLLPYARCSCGAPVCAHCKRIRDLHKREGIWEGP